MVKNILSNLPLGFISKKTKFSTGIEIDYDFARVSILEKNEEGKITFSLTPFEFEITGDSTQDGLIIKDEIEKRGLQIKSANFSLPSSSVLFKNLKIPILSEKELKDAIEWNIKEDIENLKSETIYDYSLLSKEDNFLNILVVIAKKQQVERILEISKEAKIEANIIEPSPISLLNMAQIQKNKVSKNKEEKNICVIHLDKNDSFMVFYNDSNLTLQPIDFNSEIYKNLDPDEKEQEVVRLINEINYFFLTIQEPKIIYSSGLFAKYPEIKAYMQLKFSTRFILEDLDPIIAFDIDYKGNYPIPVFNTAISLAYRGINYKHSFE